MIFMTRLLLLIGGALRPANGLLGALALIPIFATGPLVADPVVLADFEKDTGGFSGPIVRDTTEAQSGQASGKVALDLSADNASPWETLSKGLTFKNGIDSLDFWVKTSD